MSCVACRLKLSSTLVNGATKIWSTINESTAPCTTYSTFFQVDSVKRKYGDDDDDDDEKDNDNGVVDVVDVGEGGEYTMVEEVKVAEGGI